MSALRGRKCILFAGSGLSAAVGYPTWGEMVMRLVAEARKVRGARTRGLEEIEAKRDWFTLAEFARTTLSPYAFGEVLREMLGDPAEPTRAHEIIARTDYRGIITTNYDRLIEFAFTRVRNVFPTVFTTKGLEEMARALFTPRPFIYKMHGDIDQPSSTVMTASDYDRMILYSPHARSFLHGALLNNCLLFVGYSLSDPDFQLILRELALMFENYVPEHFALLPEGGDVAADQLLRRMNIHTLPYDPADGHREAVEILEQIREIAPFHAQPLRAAS